MADRLGVELVELVADPETVAPEPGAKLVLGASFRVHWPAKGQLALVQLAGQLVV